MTKRETLRIFRRLKKHNGINLPQHYVNQFSENVSRLLTQEQWKPIRGWTGIYEISNFGRVRSLKRNSGSSTNFKTRILKPRPAGTPKRIYKIVALRCDSKNKPRRDVYVHRLVTRTFIGVCPKGKEVCHFDGDPANNKLSNLGYMSHRRIHNLKRKKL